MIAQSLREQYERETGEQAIIKQPFKPRFAVIGYVHWLEQKVLAMKKPTPEEIERLARDADVQPLAALLAMYKLITGEEYKP